MARHRDVRAWMILVFVQALVPLQVTAQEPWDFLECRGDTIYEGGRPFRFVGFNIPNLHNVEDHFAFGQQSSWRWPDTFEINDALESVRQLGGTVVRTYVLSVYRPGSDADRHVHVLGPGQYNEEAFRALDQVLETARQKRIRVVIPLVDQWKWWGGAGEYAAFRKKPAEGFWTDPELRQDFRDVVRYVLQRRNSVNGIPYGEDPTILAWETGNELDSPAEWTRDIAGWIKQVAPRQLVIDGNSLHGVLPSSLDDENVDIITTHHYPQDGGSMQADVAAAIRATRGRKPYFVGEFGFVDTPAVQSLLETVAPSHCSGALLWSLRFHSREGGFYWHAEPAGGGRFKAYHWPGFASGQAYDERNVLRLVRGAAHAIRGLPIAPVDSLQAPRLIEPTEPRQLRWQGSAGAESYDVQVAEDPGGPWRPLAQGVSDAATPYRPLFVDSESPPGAHVYYRVIARHGDTASAPSNVVGPVRIGAHLLVDEFNDLSTDVVFHGQVRRTQDQPRRFEEDFHRLWMGPGASLVYTLAHPVRRWKLWAFEVNPGYELRIDVSSDGRRFRPCTSTVRQVPRGEGDYDYAVRSLVQGSTDLPDARLLRISLRRQTEPPSTEVTIAAQSPIREPSRESPPNDVPSGCELGRLELVFAHPDAEGESPGDRSVLSQVQAVTPLEPSIGLFSLECLHRAETFVDRAHELGARRVNFVVTLHAKLDADRRVVRYGLRRAPGQDFQAMSEGLRTEITHALSRAFQRAVDHGMAIAILPHLDDAGPSEVWRNRFQFDPLELLHGYSYDSALMQPIVAALRQSTPPNTPVILAMGGEMGRSLFMYPESYRTLAWRLRKRRPGPDLKLGIALNHNNLADEYQTTAELRSSLRQLMLALDFVGFSNYGPIPVPPRPEAFANHVNRFLKELASLGVTLSDRMPLHFSEIGLGGYGEQGLTHEAAEAARVPYLGAGPHQPNPWQDPEMSAFRREYHRALLSFLDHPTPQHPVTAAFLWSVGSWDPQGIREPGRGDPEIQEAIRKHNRSAEDSLR